MEKEIPKTKKMKPAQMHSANRVEERKMHISGTTLAFEVARKYISLK